MVLHERTSPISFPAWRHFLASCTRISNSIHALLAGCNRGLQLLHRSKWWCLASTYSAEIDALTGLLDQYACFQGKQDCIYGPLLLRPLEALEQVMQKAEACIQDYVIPTRSDSDYHSWLVDKALKLAMSTDVLDIHLHDFLWASSTVRDQVFRIVGIEDWMQSHLMQQAQELCEIWSNVDTHDDLQSAQSFLMGLKCKNDNVETSRLVDFLVRKLSHIEATHSHVAPHYVPSYMCLPSDECLQKNTEVIFMNNHTEVREVAWLGGRFMFKSFKHMADDLFSKNDDFFHREAAIQARVCHSHVVPLVCCTERPLGLLMEVMQEDLRAFISRCRGSSEMDPPFPDLLFALDLLLQIAKAMEYLHSDTLRIIHRDLKSGNILVSFAANTISADGSSNSSRHALHAVRLKVADFGISKAKLACVEYTTRDQGTVLWMAPEVYDMGMKDGKYSNKADVYSFGMVCYEILTGKLPFEGPRVRGRVLAGERPLLPRQYCPAALCSFIEMCWDKDPSKRPSFTQICRMLRYMKACLFLEQSEASSAVQAHDWISRSLISYPSLCARIDDMIHSSLAGISGGQRLALIDRIPPLRIPLEMYWYGVQLNTYYATAHRLHSIQLENAHHKLSHAWSWHMPQRLRKPLMILGRCLHTALIILERCLHTALMIPGLFPEWCDRHACTTLFLVSFLVICLLPYISL